MVTPLNKQIAWIIYHLPAYKVLNANLVKGRREFVLNKGQILCERLMFWFLEDLLISSVISFFFFNTRIQDDTFNAHNSYGHTDH